MSCRVGRQASCASLMQQPDFKKTDDMFNRVLIWSNIAVICLFENIKTGTQHIIANVHIC